MRRHFISSVCSAVLVLAGMALAQQSIKGIATGCPVGIFVHLGPRIAARGQPSEDVAGYRLERRIFGQKDWAQVADVQAPASLSELQSGLDRVSTFVPGLDRVPRVVAETLWQKAARKRMVDSLGFWGANIQVRVAFGTMYLDRTAMRDTDYEYRISELDTAGNTRFWALSDTMHWPLAVQFAPVKLLEKHATRNEVLLRWLACGDKQQLSMVVYRRIAGLDEFELIRPVRAFTRSKDTVFYHVRDTTVQPMLCYEYYMRAMCPYGNTGAPSEMALVGTYRFVEVPLPDSVAIRSMDSLPGVALSWRLKEPGPVKSLRIYRSRDYDTGFVKVAELGPDAHRFEDASAEEAQRYYYTMEMRGWMGEVSPRTPRAFGTYFSTLIPAAPGGLSGVGTARGVRLSWDWDREPVAGFYVYRSRGPRDSLRLVSERLLPRDSIMVFEDTAPELESYYSYAYAVQSESKSHLRSVLAETAYVQPAKPTHPRAPFDLEAAARDGEVKLFWMDMRSAVKALAGYQVYRRELDSLGNGPELAPLGDTGSFVPAQTNSYADATVEPGRAYEYAIRCRDMFGGTSPLSEPAIAAVRGIEVVPPAGLRAWKTNEGVAVAWDETIQDSITWYRLYRSEREPISMQETGETPVEPKPALVTTLPADQREFTDRKVTAGKLYRYYVTCVSPDGRESEPGEKVSVRY